LHIKGRKKIFHDEKEIMGLNLLQNVYHISTIIWQATDL